MCSSDLAPLFLIAGALAHRLGTRRLPELFGLWHRGVSGSRVLVVVLLAASYALAGGPGTVSFVAKELFLGAAHHAAASHPALLVVVAMAVLAAACNVAIVVRLVATVFGWRLGVRDDLPGQDVAHDKDRWGPVLWVPAAGLVLVQYIGGLLPPVWNSVFRRLEVNVNDEAFTDGLPWLWERSEEHTSELQSQ